MQSIAREMIELRVPSKAEYVPVIRTLVTDLARRMAFPRSAIEDVRVAISEACANVVRHAYAGKNSGANELVVRCSTQDGRLLLEVVDNGQGFVEGSKLRAPTSSINGGFGLILIRNLMDQVSLDTSPDRGTVVRMVKSISRGTIGR